MARPSLREMPLLCALSEKNSSRLFCGICSGSVFAGEVSAEISPGSPQLSFRYQVQRLGLSYLCSYHHPVGFVVGRAHWGKGFCSAAVELAIGYGFKELGLVEVCAEVLTRSVASRRILDKLGFRIERSAASNPQQSSGSEDCCTYALRTHEK